MDSCSEAKIKLSIRAKENPVKDQSSSKSATPGVGMTNNLTLGELLKNNKFSNYPLPSHENESPELLRVSIQTKDEQGNICIYDFPPPGERSWKK